MKFTFILKKRYDGNEASKSQHHMKYLVTRLETKPEHVAVMLMKAFDHAVRATPSREIVVSTNNYEFRGEYLDIAAPLLEVINLYDDGRKFPEFEKQLKSKINMWCGHQGKPTDGEVAPRIAKEEQ